MIDMNDLVRAEVIKRNGARFRYDARFDSCPRCGAWKWEQTSNLLIRDMMRCGECAFETQRENVWAVRAEP